MSGDDGDDVDSIFRTLLDDIVVDDEEAFQGDMKWFIDAMDTFIAQLGVSETGRCNMRQIGTATVEEMSSIRWPRRFRDFVEMYFNNVRMRAKFVVNRAAGRGDDEAVPAAGPQMVPPPLVATAEDTNIPCRHEAMHHACSESTQGECRREAPQ